MTVRVVKNEIRSVLRKAIFEHPLSEEPARRNLTPILNRLMASTDESAAYWLELKERVRAVAKSTINVSTLSLSLSLIGIYIYPYTIISEKLEPNNFAPLSLFISLSLPSLALTLSISLSPSITFFFFFALSLKFFIPFAN